MGHPAVRYNTDRSDRAALITALQYDWHWATAYTIRTRVGLTPVRIRELAQIYPTLLVSSTEGYKLTLRASKAEIKHCVQSLLQRSEKIMARASALAGII